MMRKCLVTLGGVYLIYIIIVILTSAMSEHIAFRVCLNGCDLSDEKNVISYGDSRDGPWIIIKNEELLYECVTKKGRIKNLTKNDIDSAPEPINRQISLGVEGVVREVKAGHYLYIVRQPNQFLIWSISL
ncbi:MAG: hypothetical protein ACSHX6_00990 [Akkermansiaceae bacterium]